MGKNEWHPENLECMEDFTRAHAYQYSFASGVIESWIHSLGLELYGEKNQEMKLSDKSEHDIPPFDFWNEREDYLNYYAD